MNVLEAHRRVMTWLCVCPVDETASRLTKPACILFCAFVFVILTSGVSVSVTYVVRNISTDLEGCLYALYQIVAFFSMLYTMMISMFLRPKMASLFNTLTSIYNANAQEETFKYLARTNDRNEWMWKMYFIFILGGFAVSTSSVVGLSLVICRLFIGDFDTKYVFHPYEMMWVENFPWNQHTGIGYAYEIVFSMIAAEAYLVCNGALLLLFIAVCLNHNAFYKMFVDSTRKLDHIDNNRNDAQHLAKLIRFHCVAKGWFSDTSELYSLYILVQLICSMIFLASAIFQLDLHSGDIDYRMSVLMMSVLISCTNLFGFCYFGKMATESYSEMPDLLYGANWPALPVHLQKYFILMIGNAQIPMFYHGFGVAILNLDTFSKMIKTVITYYMMFKTLTTN